MLSRVAESLYWLGRYAERAENTARIVSVNANLLLDLPRGISPGWSPMIAIFGAEADFESRYANYEERSVARYLLTDADSPCSVLFVLRAARENTRTMRDIVPREAWELLNELYHYARDNAQAGLSKRGRHDYLQHVIRSIQTLSGLLLGTMNHDQGYSFLTLGRVLERADMTTRLIDVRSNSLLPDTPAELRSFAGVQWMSVLKSLSGYQMYRQKMQSRLVRAKVLEFLLRDPEFPRAVARCARLLEAGLRSLPCSEDCVRVLGGLQRVLQRGAVVELAEDQQALHAYLDELQVHLAAVHAEIARAWFLHGASA
ncbi:MAG: alpha-E domain-containing protein [Pseudomonadota bacterium]